ncbi:MAG: hypothetical protein IPG89_16820 [Bacteroidetes bacterium]|nr:hypothetical protein [Bacteroidota bacterium]
MNTKKETKTDLKQIVVDVRTIEEWENDGHTRLHCKIYPLDSLIQRLKN